MLVRMAVKMENALTKLELSQMIWPLQIAWITQKTYL